MCLRLGPLVVLVAIVIGCGRPAAVEPVAQPLRLSASPAGGTYFRLSKSLAEVFNRRIQGIEATVSSEASALDSINALDEGRDDLAVARADAVYAAYTAGTPARPKPYDDLRAIAVIHKSVLHVIAGRDSRISSVTELGGQRVVFGMSALNGGSSMSRYRDLLHSLQIFADVRPGAMKAFDQAVGAVEHREADVAFILTGYPLAPLSRLASSAPIRLLEIDRGKAERIRSRYPFYKPTFIPAGTYPGQDHPIATVGVDNLLVCQKTLDEQLVYHVTKALFESLPELAAANETAKQIDPDLAPTAPIPLHSGSARYYRERELLR